MRGEKAQRETARDRQRHPAETYRGGVGKPRAEIGRDGSAGFERDAPIEVREPDEPSAELGGERTIETPLRPVGGDGLGTRADVGMRQKSLDRIAGHEAGKRESGGGDRKPGQRQPSQRPCRRRGDHRARTRSGRIT